MSGFVKIYKYGDTQDFDQIGYYYNIDILARPCTSVNFLPFYRDGLAKSTTIAEFKLKKLSFTNGIKSVTDTTTLSTAYIDFDIGDNRKTFYYNADEDLGITEAGKYEYYIKDSTGVEYFSETICFSPEGITAGGSFDSSFDSSFSIGITTSTTAQTIKVYDIPNVYPETGSKTNRYVDSIYTDSIIEKTGESTTNVITDKPFRATFDTNNWLSRKVQSLVYDSYQIRLFGGENSGIGLIEKAQDVVITDKTGKTFQANILSIQKNPLGDTKLIEYVVEFEDINVDNYKDRKQPVANFMDSDYIKLRYSPNLVTLKINNPFTETTVEYYSTLVPEKNNEQSIHTETHGKNVYDVQKINRFRINARFYLTDNQRILFEEKVADSGYNISVIYSGQEYKHIQANDELRYTKSNDGLTGIWQVDISLVYNTNAYDYFTTTSLAKRFTAQGISIYEFKMYGTIESTVVSLWVYTPIGYKTVTEIDNKSMKRGTGISEVSTYNIRTIYKLVLYVNGNDLVTMQKYIKSNVTCELTGIVNYYALEPPQTEWTKVEGFEDLFRVEMDFVAENLRINNYE